jgi:hypothetical protein
MARIYGKLTIAFQAGYAALVKALLPSAEYRMGKIVFMLCLGNAVLVDLIDDCEFPGCGKTPPFSCPCS